MSSVPPVTVSPGVGRRSVNATMSTLIEPTTRIRDAATGMLSPLTLAHELHAKRPEIGKLLVWLAGPQGLQALAVAGGCQLLQTWIHFLREQAHRGECLGIRQETGLAHHEQMAESSGVFPEIFNLGEHLIRGPGKDIAPSHLLIQPGNQRDASAAACAPHDLGRYRRCMIARRITPMLRHFVGRHVPQHFFRPGTGLLRILANVDQRGIGQAVEWRLLAVGRAVGGAIAIVDLTDAWIASQKYRPGIGVLRHWDSAPAAADRNPDG